MHLCCRNHMDRIAIGILGVRLFLAHRRGGVADADRQRGFHAVQVRIRQRVGEHIFHTAGTAVGTRIAIAAVSADGQRAVLASHLHGSITHGLAGRTQLASHHGADPGTIGALRVIDQHIAGHRLAHIRLYIGHIIQRHRDGILHVHIKGTGLRFLIRIGHGKGDALERDQVLARWRFRVRDRLQQRHLVAVSDLPGCRIRQCSAGQRNRQHRRTGRCACQLQAVSRQGPDHILAQRLQLGVQTISRELDRLQQIALRHVVVIADHQLAFGLGTFHRARQHAHAQHRCRRARQCAFAHRDKVLRHDPDILVRLQRDLHRGGGGVAVSISNGVAEAVFRGVLAGTWVRRVGELAGRCIVADCALYRLLRHCHLGQRHAVGTLDVVGQGINHQRLVFLHLRKGIVPGRRDVVHDLRRQHGCRLVAIVVSQHDLQVFEQRVLCRTCRMRLATLEQIAVAHLARSLVVTGHRQFIAQRREQPGSRHDGSILQELGAANRQAFHAVLALDGESGVTAFCRTGGIRACCQRFFVHLDITTLRLGRQAVDLRLVVRRRRAATTPQQGQRQQRQPPERHRRMADTQRLAGLDAFGQLAHGIGRLCTFRHKRISLAIFMRTHQQVVRALGIADRAVILVIILDHQIGLAHLAALEGDMQILADTLGRQVLGRETRGFVGEVVFDVCQRLQAQRLAAAAGTAGTAGDLVGLDGIAGVIDAQGDVFQAHGVFSRSCSGSQCCAIQETLLGIGAGSGGPAAVRWPAQGDALQPAQRASGAWPNSLISTRRLGWSHSVRWRASRGKRARQSLTSNSRSPRPLATSAPVGSRFSASA